MSITRLARPEILALKPYSSAASLGPRADMVRLDANENPYRAPSGEVGRLELNRYPDLRPVALMQKLAALYDISPESLLVTRGSDEGIDLLVRTFCRAGVDSVAILPPTFDMYGIAAQIQGAGIVEVPLGDGFTLNTDAVIEAVQAADNVKLLFLCSPNNPTGNAMAREAVLALLDALPDTVVVVDEAYFEFAAAISGDPGFAGELANRENLVVLRTLSKAYGLAGARCGAVLAAPDVIELLSRVIAPYSVPVPVQAAALEALSPAGLARTRDNIRNILGEKERLGSALVRLAAVEEIYPSDTNFLLVRFADREAVFASLKAAGILVRDRDAQVSGCLRITVGTPEENSLLLAALGAEDLPSQAARTGTASRSTKETSIYVSVDLDATPRGEIDTGIAFFDHMLDQFATHGGFEMVLKCEGDTEVDAHHTIEDCMLTLGEAISKALGDRKGIGRYGFIVPMDEVRAEVLIDMSGRPFASFEGDFDDPAIGDLPTQMIPHAFHSLAQTLGAAIQVRVDGENDHHKAEGAFKALGRAFRAAKTLNAGSETGEMPSTKGVL